MTFDEIALVALQAAAGDAAAIGRVVTLGRQELHLPPRLAQAWEVSPEAQRARYCETLLFEKFGAKSVDSLDISAYEGATVLHDLNHPISSSLADRYDTILDLGTLEHIYDAAVAFENICRMVSIGGRVIHVVPSNGYSGHGLYQFSADLFHNLYNKNRGYTDVAVYVVRRDGPRDWFAVPTVIGSERINIESLGRLLLMCHARKTHNARAAIFQTDYMREWSLPNLLGIPSDCTLTARVGQEVSMARGTLGKTLLRLTPRPIRNVVGKVRSVAKLIISPVKSDKPLKHIRLGPTLDTCSSGGGGLDSLFLNV